MYCRICGAEIPDDSRFCPECGAAISDDSIYQSQEERFHRASLVSNNSANRKKIIGGIIIGAILVIVVLALTLSFKAPEININDYVYVSFLDHDGIGNAGYGFDYDRLAKEHGDDILSAYRRMHKDNSFQGIVNEIMHKDEVDYDRLTKSFVDTYVECVFDKDYGLSNGDIVTLFWNCDTEYVLEKTGIKLICEDQEYTVSGLEPMPNSDSSNSYADNSYTYENNTDEGIIFPESSYEIIDEYRIQALTDVELRYAINEIFARNGYIFKDESLRQYYSQYDWYYPHIAPENFTESIFNEIEYQNVDAMQKERELRK
jgi:hypothetical protein